ncbi:MAG TPA: hypothetical protein VF074_20180 [Pyrinomonadaceae bacterium]
MKQLARLILLSILACTSIVVAQDQPTATPSAEELEKQKAEWTKNAYRLLDQVLDEAQSLRLPENRVRIQINAADILWDRDQARARSLYTMAGDAVAEIMRTGEAPRRPGPNQNRRPTQIRQELVLGAARHDAQLAYQLLAVTKPPATTTAETRIQAQAPMGPEDNLEQSLLAAVAALDPKLAAQNAEQLLEKGQFPYSVSDVIYQLRRQDPEAAAKLADKTVKRIQSTNLIGTMEAEMLALRLLNLGPRVQTTNTTEANSKTEPPARGPVLDQSLYVDLLGTVIDTALKTNINAAANQRAGNQRPPRGPNAGTVVRPNAQNVPSQIQVEQVNARRLLAGLQRLLPQIDQNLPARSQAVRQKLTESGMGDSPRNALSQTLNALQGENPTAESLLQAAATAPQQLQARLYQQAAYKALDEGNVDRARQIATSHLDPRLRDVVMQRIDFRELATKAEATRLEEVRQSLARLPSDNERIDLLVLLAGDVDKKNPKLARQLLEEARQLTNKRATNYEHFEQQLKVAYAFVALEPSRAIEVLDPPISQLNELLSAAALLSGFETNVFRDGELPLQGGSTLTNTVNRYGQAIAALARQDLERSETLAGRFQFPESRIMVRMAIVQGLLGKSRQQNEGFRLVENFGNFGFTYTRPN